MFIVLFPSFPFLSGKKMQGTVYRHYWQHLIVFFLSIIYCITVFFSEMFGDDRQEEQLAARGNTLEV